ncbi:MAG: energy transducer TonB [Muribaculaceae bacterium]|nr:energy transducer TonB [Muribaculaceae bacterium]MDE5957348.1 energy transducer TonB [Muribaculaceae bacterium]
MSTVFRQPFILFPGNSLRVALLAAAMLAPLPLLLRAQTCRVAMGVNADGRRAYMEVFEYDYVPQKPSFPGGDWALVNYINTHRQYPRKAYEAGVEGRVTCSFVVNTDGSISHVKVIKSVEETLNREAVRILAEMPSWEPGRLDDGRTVPVRVIWSIPFRK